jgi:cyclophilin family peptidyl-prolyl cis-trans isomerase
MKELRMQQQRKRRTQLVFAGGIGSALVLIVVIVLIAVLTGGNGKKTAAPTTTSPSTTATTAAVTTTTGVTHISVPLINAGSVGCPKLNGTSPHYTHFLKAPPMCIKAGQQYTAHLVTNVGTITVKLLPSQSRAAVNNFVFLSLYHFFDGTEFHRVITGFVDQGGDPTGTGTGGPGYSFNGGEPKTAKVYTAGALAMANDGGNPATDGSQFFFVVDKGGLSLKPLYSYFGQVTAGMSVVNKINADGSASGTPAVIDKILKVTITES